jgi:hypothetical protein
VTDKQKAIEEWLQAVRPPTHAHPAVRVKLQTMTAKAIRADIERLRREGAISR